jgi:hypothetical protein
LPLDLPLTLILIYRRSAGSLGPRRASSTRLTPTLAVSGWPHRSRTRTRRSQSWVSELAGLLRPGAQVLDLGCGSGDPGDPAARAAGDRRGLLGRPAAPGPAAGPGRPPAADRYDRAAPGASQPGRGGVLLRSYSCAAGPTAGAVAPNEKTSRPGLAEGLWLPAGADVGNWVFGSTIAKPGTTMHAAVSASKLVPRSVARPRSDTGQQAWNPPMLKLTVLACGRDDSRGGLGADTSLRLSPR